jgi:hypothetical protein
MWFWPVNQMIDLVFGMPAPKFEDAFGKLLHGGKKKRIV